MEIASINGLIEALQAGSTVERVWIAETRHGAKIEQIRRLCRQRGVLFRLVPEAALKRRVGQDHQGVAAEISPFRLFSLEAVLADCPNRLLLLLDRLEDTGNMGAILRAAAGAGIDGVVLSARYSAPLNETVWRRSAGTAGRVRLVRSANLATDLALIKAAGFWVIGADSQAVQKYTAWDFQAPTALVLGNEGRGLSPLLRKRLDAAVAIPLANGVESLNVAVAAGVLLFEVLRQRSFPGKA